MSEPQPPNDRELEEFLARRSAVSQAYRESFPDAAAPPEFDAAIHHAAAAELARSRKRFQRWRLPTALAASLIVALLARELVPGALNVRPPLAEQAENIATAKAPEPAAEAALPASPATNAPAALPASPPTEVTATARRAERRAAPAAAATAPRSEPVPDATGQALPAAPPVIADRTDQAAKASAESALQQASAEAFDRPPPPPPPPVLAPSAVGNAGASAVSAAAAPSPPAAKARADDADRIITAEVGRLASASASPSPSPSPATYPALLNQRATSAEVRRRYGAAPSVLLDGLQTLRYDHIDERGPVRFEFRDGRLQRVLLTLQPPRALVAVLAQEAIDPAELVPMISVPACAPDALAPASEDAPHRYSPAGQRLLRIEAQQVTELWWLASCVSSGG